MPEQRTPQIEAMPDFQAGLAGIINKPLTAEIIDTYAESALDNLAELLQQVTEAYPVGYAASNKELEDAACAYFGLERIEETLDHIAAKADEIQELDATIAAVNTVDTIITPPDPTAPPEPGVGNTFEERHTIPRLKTLLFVLANDFEIDVKDHNQVIITKGTIDPDMVRSESYYAVEVPTLQRVVLVCDEVRNATFVFDSDALQNKTVGTDELMGYTKEELRALLEAAPQAGQRIVYSQNFVPELVAALTQPSSTVSPGEESIDTTSTGRYLVPKAPEDVISLSGLAEALGFGNPSTVKRAVQELGDELGPIQVYKFYSRRAEGYTAEQQELVRVHLEKQGYKHAPEGFLTQHSLAKALGPHDTTISRVIKDLGEELGQIQSFKSKRGITPFYSPEQQEMIREALAGVGQFVNEPPEDVLAITGIAKVYGTGRGHVETAVRKLGKDLGEVRTYKFSGGITNGYSAEQQGMLLSQMYVDGAFAEPAPDGILNIHNMARSSQFGIGDAAIKSTIESLGDELGEVNIYRFGSKAAEGYTPEQQELILKHLEEAGHLEKAPEGYVSATELADQLDVYRHVIYKVVQHLGKALGETKTYRTAKRTAAHYSPAQQESIRNAIADKGLFASDPPEGYRAIAGIARDLGLAHQTVSKSVEQLGEALEDASGYTFGSQTVTGYSPHQQEAIAQHAIARLIP